MTESLALKQGALADGAAPSSPAASCVAAWLRPVPQQALSERSDRSSVQQDNQPGRSLTADSEVSRWLRPGGRNAPSTLSGCVVGALLPRRSSDLSPCQGSSQQAPRKRLRSKQRPAGEDDDDDLCQEHEAEVTYDERNARSGRGSRMNNKAWTRPLCQKGLQLCG